MPSLSLSRRPGLGPLILPLLALGTLFGCSSATWKSVRTTPNYQAPKSVAVSISVETAGEGLSEAMGELQVSLASVLKSYGITAMVGPTPGAKVAEVRVTQWNPGSRWLRYWMVRAGEGSMVVLVRVLSADGKPEFSGVVRGTVNGGWFGGSSSNAATDAGEAIGKAIATGKAEQAQEQ